MQSRENKNTVGCRWVLQGPCQASYGVGDLLWQVGVTDPTFIMREIPHVHMSALERSLSYCREWILVRSLVKKAHKNGGIGQQVEYFLIQVKLIGVLKYGSSSNRNRDEYEVCLKIKWLVYDNHWMRMQERGMGTGGVCLTASTRWKIELFSEKNAHVGKEV